ncbi:putative ribonuclease H protein, partial [Mucuna pruriens]
MKKHLRSLSLQQGFDNEIIFHLTCLSCALKDYFNLLMWLWKINLESNLAFSRGPQLSHLAFDLFLFYKNRKHIRTIFQLFCKSFKQKVSSNKSQIYFSIYWQVKEQISKELRFQHIDNLEKYLRVPILHKRVNIYTYQFIMDKVNQRLSTWKTKQLSFVGRVTLTKLVLHALLTYVMQSIVLEKSICNIINKKCKNYIWGYVNHSKNIHMASWSSICSPKNHRRLGLREISIVNQAFIMKLGWRLVNNHQDLCVWTIHSKYNYGFDILPWINVN